MNKTEITAALRSLGKEKVLSENSGKGAGSLLLILRRGASDAVTCTWFAKWKRGGKVSKLQLGIYPDMTIDQAREAFRDQASQALKAGRNPLTAARVADSPTVERLFKAYITSMRAKGRSTADDVEQKLLLSEFNAADMLGRHKSAGEVTGDDITDVLARTFKRGARTLADRLRAYMSAAFNWGTKASNDYTAAVREDWGIKVNPVATVQRDTGATKAGSRNLSAGEIAAAWRGVKGPGYALETQCAVRALLGTGQRVQETLRVHGDEIDLKAATWTMPPEKTKGKKREHIVPLPPQAVEAFALLKSVHGDGPLFPAFQKGRNAAKRGKYMTHRALARAMKRMCEDIELAPFTPRDIRRTWKSRAADAGVDRFTRDLIQQHAKIDTGSKHYDWADYLPQMREAMTKWGAWLTIAIAKGAANDDSENQSRSDAA